MAFDRAEYEAHRKATEQRDQAEHYRDIRRVQMADVPMQLLTGSMEWDAFLKFAQPFVEWAEENLEAQRRMLVNGPYERIEDLAKMRERAQFYEGALLVAKTLMQLPEAILKDAENAGKLMKSLQDAIDSYTA